MMKRANSRLRRRPLLAAAALWILVAFAAGAQNDPTTRQPIFHEPRTLIPSMNGGAANVLRAVYDDQVIPRLVRKSDGSSVMIEETAITHTWDGQIPGNTYRVMPGEKLPITVVNDLMFEYTVDQLKTMKILGNNDGEGVQQLIHSSMNVTNLHVHGLHVSPQGFQDNVLLHANPGKSIPYSYDIPKIHAPGTHWYHPHHHGSTALQVTQGMVGALIVGEPPGQNLTPSGWPALERLLVVRANGEQSIVDLPADSDPALKSLFPAQDPQTLPNDMERLVAALKTRTGGGGSAVKAEQLIDQLESSGQMERLLEAVEDLLQPPTFTVNGLLNPVDEIEPGQLVRMRIVNAGSRVRDYKDYYLEGHDIFLAAMDGVNLVSLPRASGDGSFAGYVAYNDKRKLTLAPGNRADVYFIARNAGKHALMADLVPRHGAPAQSRQALMTFEISAPDFSTKSARSAAGDAAELERFLGDLDANLKRLQGVGAYAAGQYLSSITAKKVDAERTVVFDVRQAKARPYFINSRSYNEMPGHESGHVEHSTMPGATDFLGKAEGDGGVGPRGQTPWPIRRGTVEKWVIQNKSPGRRHPFHIHVNPAFVVGIVENGKPVPAGDPRLGRWQDTIDLPPATQDGIPGEVTILHRFEDYEGLYVLHCHILQHEDRGMMINVMIMPPDDNDKQGYFDKLVKTNAELNARIND